MKNYLMLIIETALRDSDMLDTIPTSRLRSMSAILNFHAELRDRQQRTEPMDTPVSYFEFSERTKNVLHNENIGTIRELIKFGRAGLLEAPMCGLKTIAEIEKTLLSLGVLPDDWDQNPD